MSDAEVPEADALEQAQPVDEADEPVGDVPEPRIDIETPEADAVEQAQELPPDDER